MSQRRVSGEDASGKTCKMLYYNRQGFVWDGGTFAQWNDLLYANYLMPAVENGTSGQYWSDPPEDAISFRMIEVVDSTVANDLVVYQGDISFPTNFREVIRTKRENPIAVPYLNIGGG